MSAVDDSLLIAIGDNTTLIGTTSNALQGKIDLEGLARVAGDALLQANIVTTSNALSDVDATLQSNINNEIADRTLADNLERGERLAGDIVLSNSIVAEANARIDADNDLRQEFSLGDVALSNAFFDAYAVTLQDDFTSYASNLVGDAVGNAMNSNGIVGVIRKVGDEIHIGENSLVTAEITNGVSSVEQWLYAENAEGNAIDLVITNGSSLRIGEEEVLTDSDYADLLSQMASGVTNLQTNIDNVQEDINDEIILRGIADIAIRNDFGAADATLNSNLTAEVSRLDTKIDDETAARIQEDINLNARIDALALVDNAADIAENSLRISENRKMIDQNRKGIAMVAALTHSTVLPGKSHALDISAASFEGEMGVAINYSGRLDENTQINFGYSGTGLLDENIIRGGIGFQW